MERVEVIPGRTSEWHVPVVGVIQTAEAVASVALDGETQTVHHLHKPSTKSGDVYGKNGTLWQDWLCTCGYRLERRSE